MTNPALNFIRYNILMLMHVNHIIRLKWDSLLIVQFLGMG